MIIDLKQHMTPKKYTIQFVRKCIFILLLIGVLGINTNAQSKATIVAGTSITTGSSAQEHLNRYYCEHFQMEWAAV
jgi:hypothetical protein